MEFMDVRIAGLREWWDLIGDGKMFTKNKNNAACRMSDIEWRVVDFRKCLLQPIIRNSGWFRVRRFADIQEEIWCRERSGGGQYLSQSYMYEDGMRKKVEYHLQCITQISRVYYVLCFWLLCFVICMFLFLFYGFYYLIQIKFEI